MRAIYVTSLTGKSNFEHQSREGRRIRVNKIEIKNDQFCQFFPENRRAVDRFHLNLGYSTISDV